MVKNLLLRELLGSIVIRVRVIRELLGLGFIVERKTGSIKYHSCSIASI